MPNMKKYNWLKIQKFHDAGNTWREIQKHFGVCQAAISLARKRGDFISRNHSDANKIAYKKGRGCKKHSEQTKRKISKARIKYLTENPDKVPYLINHSSKKSYPETIFEQALISSGITGWVYAYQNGIYEYDFAWPKQKIDVEIDGSTHNLPKVQKIDARRDKFSIDNGWIVVRFSADRVKKDIISCINELKALL
jgi:very-short-patch-repair endonuclease